MAVQLAMLVFCEFKLYYQQYDLLALMRFPTLKVKCEKGNTLATHTDIQRQSGSISTTGNRQRHSSK